MRIGHHALSLLLMLVPAAAWGQQGWQHAEGVTLAQVYDDDLAAGDSSFGAASFTQASPRLTIGYGNEWLAVLARGSVDVELADAAPVRQMPLLRASGRLELSAQATSRLSWTASAGALDTDTPRDFTLLTGLNPGRSRLQSFTAAGALDYRFGQRDRGIASLDAATLSDGGILLDEETARLTLHHQFTALTGARLDAIGHRYDFGQGNVLAVVTPLLGWDQRLTPKLTVEAQAGPRFTGGALEGFEGAASLRWEEDRMHLSLNLVSTQSAVPGLVGVADAVSVSILMVLRPAETLRVSLAPAIYETSGVVQSQVFEARLEAVKTLNDWVSLLATYRLSMQNATLPVAGGISGASLHNLFVVGCSFSSPPAAGLPLDAPSARAWSVPGGPTRP